MIAQSVAEKMKLLLEATDGEIERVIDRALKRIYPEEELTLLDLKARQDTGGVLQYFHPDTGALIGEKTVRPARIENRSSFVSSRYTYRYTKKIPHRESILLFSPQGHADTRISIEHADIPDSYTEKIPVVTGIKEYYPPAKKRQKRSRYKTPRDDQKRASRNLRAARAFKRANGSASPVNGAQTRLGPRKNGVIHSTSSSNGSAKVTYGAIRRERAFRLKPINGREKRVETPESLTLEGRSAKDIFKHPDGSYTTIQYSSAGYTTILYNPYGKRLEQQTFSSEGELTKALGESTAGPTLKKRKPRLPSDKVSLMRARDCEAIHELHDLRRAWQELDTDIDAMLMEEYEGTSIDAQNHSENPTPNEA